jgi:hypothetical protein
VELDEESKLLIAAKVAAAEMAGEEGDVDAAQRFMEVGSRWDLRRKGCPFQRPSWTPPITFEGIKFSPPDEWNRKALVRAQNFLVPYES